MMLASMTNRDHQPFSCGQHFVGTFITAGSPHFLKGDGLRFWKLVKGWELTFFTNKGGYVKKGGDKIKKVEIFFPEEIAYYFMTGWRGVANSWNMNHNEDNSKNGATQQSHPQVVGERWNLASLKVH